MSNQGLFVLRKVSSANFGFTNLIRNFSRKSLNVEGPYKVVKSRKPQKKGIRKTVTNDITLIIQYYTLLQQIIYIQHGEIQTLNFQRQQISHSSCRAMSDQLGTILTPPSITKGRLSWKKQIMYQQTVANLIRPIFTIFSE